MATTASRSQVMAHFYATDAQLSYLRTLLDQAFVHHFEHGLRLDRHHLDNMPREHASLAIAALKGAKERGWRTA